MACYSHTWELAGISKVIQALNSSSCRVHFSGEGSNEALRLRMRASEESCMDLSQSPRNSLGGGHLVSKQLGVLFAFPVELQIEYITPPFRFISVIMSE